MISGEQGDFAILSVRQRLALWCVGLSTVVYVTPTILGFCFFYYGLTAALDHELKSMTSSLGHAIEIEGETPHFRDWARVVQTNPARSLTSIQLFDSHRKLLEHYGAPGIEQVIEHANEVTDATRTMRVRNTPLILGSKTVGYLQFQLPTKERDAAVRQYALALALMAPIVLIGLGVCSLFVADKAMVPIQKTIEVLKQFISDAGHELNTPLSIIVACADSLARKLERQNVPANELETISASSDRMKSIIDNLMLLAELENPVPQTQNKTSINLKELVEKTVEKFSVKFKQKEIDLRSLEVSGDLVLLCDETALETVLSNLIENALRYTDSHGQVTISAKAHGQGIQIVVSDTGIGIDKECLPFIFDRFFRVDKSRSRLSGGSGLGLSLVKAITESQGGSVSVTSQPGVGSKFTVTLPLVQT